MNIHTTTILTMLLLLLLTNHLSLSLILPKAFKSSEPSVPSKDRWLIDVIQPNLIELPTGRSPTTFTEYSSSTVRPWRGLPSRYLLTFNAGQTAFYGLLHLNGDQPVAIIANDSASDSGEPNEFCDLYNGHLFQPYSGRIAATICSNIHSDSDDLILYSTIIVNRDDGSRGYYVIRNHPYQEEYSEDHQNERPTIINIDPLNYVMEESNCSFFPNGKITKLHQHHLYTHHQENDGNDAKASKTIIDYIEPRLVAPEIHARTKRDSTNNGKVYNIETIIFVDQSLIQRMNGARSELQKLVLAIMNEVQLIYNFDSLKTRIRILIKKIVYLDPTKDAPNTANGDIDQYLDNFCSWQKQLWKRTATNSRWDHALMLTGLDLYKQIGREKNKKVLGLAWVNGMCRPSYSCTLNEGKNFESAFVIAHEMAHSLGMLHDGYDNNCDPDKYIMSEKTGPGKINWSPCSNLYLENFLKKTNLKCLEKTSDESFMFYTGLLNGGSETADMRLPGEQYSLNQQCQLALGDEYRAFITQQAPFNDICKELWCLHKNWASPAHPALEGSNCGNGKSCLQGVCTDKHQQQTKQQSMRAGSKYNSYLNALRQNDETMSAKRNKNRNKNRNNPEHDSGDQRFYTDNDGDYETPIKTHNGNNNGINSNGSTASSGIHVGASTFMRRVQRFLRNTIRSIARIFSG